MPDRKDRRYDPFAAPRNNLIAANTAGPPGSLIKEIGADEFERRSGPMPRGKGLCAETVYAQPK